MVYKNGERKFYVSVYREIRDIRNYVQVIDIDHIDMEKNSFWLPEHIIDKWEYQFSWDRYEQDLNIPQQINFLDSEISKLNIITKSENSEKYYQDLIYFKEKLEKKKETQITDKFIKRIH
jgi:hypothetical protein